MDTQRDARAFSAIQSRVDIIEHEIVDHFAQAERHWQLACWHVAQADDLAHSCFDLTAGMARLQQRLIEASSARQRTEDVAA